MIIPAAVSSAICHLSSSTSHRLQFSCMVYVSVSRHFGPKTFRHHCDGAEVSGHFGTGAEVSYGHFGWNFGHFGTTKYCLFTKRKLHAHTIKLITHIMSHVCTTNKWNKPASANTMSCDSVVLCSYYF